jgi:hypothetical protein
MSGWAPLTRVSPAAKAAETTHNPVRAIAYQLRGSWRSAKVVSWRSSLPRSKKGAPSADACEGGQGVQWMKAGELGGNQLRLLALATQISFAPGARARNSPLLRYNDSNLLREPPAPRLGGATARSGVRAQCLRGSCRGAALSEEDYRTACIAHEVL